MKRLVHVSIALACSAILLFATACQQEAAALNVNEVASDPAAYTGTITITGVTAAFAPSDASLFGLMDVKELLCTTPNCNKQIIPIRYNGGLPKLGDEVRISGTLVTTSDGYMFAADAVKVIRNHKVGS